LSDHFKGSAFKRSTAFTADSMSTRCKVEACGKWSYQDGFCREHLKIKPQLLAQSAAAAPARSVLYNGRIYKSLADHDPHSKIEINEKGKFYNLEAGWRLCQNTPGNTDALHVCQSYPWATHALVFADGSAYWTALAPGKTAPREVFGWEPGRRVMDRGQLKRSGEQYGAGLDCVMDANGRCDDDGWVSDVLICRDM
jgi:hypothetical protein